MSRPRQLSPFQHAGRFVALAAVVIVVMTLSTACGTAAKRETKKDPAVNQDLTLQAALNRSVGYLEKTLEKLPAGMSISLKPDHGGDTLDRANPLPCSNSDAATPQNTASSMQYLYWLNGIPAGKEPEYFAKIRQIWASWGAHAGAGTGSGYATYITHDGYSLVLNSSAGNGALGIGVYTPCIAPKHLNSPGEQPETIRRPKS